MRSALVECESQFNTTLPFRSISRRFWSPRRASGSGLPTPFAKCPPEIHLPVLPKLSVSHSILHVIKGARRINSATATASGSIRSNHTPSVTMRFNIVLALVSTGLLAHTVAIPAAQVAEGAILSGRGTCRIPSARQARHALT